MVCDLLGVGVDGSVGPVLVFFSFPKATHYLQPAQTSAAGGESRTRVGMGGASRTPPPKQEVAKSLKWCVGLAWRLTRRPTPKAHAQVARRHFVVLPGSAPVPKAATAVDAETRCASFPFFILRFCIFRLLIIRADLLFGIFSFPSLNLVTAHSIEVILQHSQSKPNVFGDLNHRTSPSNYEFHRFLFFFRYELLIHRHQHVLESGGWLPGECVARGPTARRSLATYRRGTTRRCRSEASALLDSASSTTHGAFLKAEGARFLCWVAGRHSLQSLDSFLIYLAIGGKG